MFYAKCIRKSQLCKTKEEFDTRKNTDQNNVYYVGKTTFSWTEINCVPLNYIFCMLKYGSIVLILEEPYNLKPYSTEQSPGSVIVQANSQKPIKAINVSTVSGIKEIINLVGSPDLIYPNAYMFDPAWTSEEAALFCITTFNLQQ